MRGDTERSVETLWVSWILRAGLVSSLVLIGLGIAIAASKGAIDAVRVKPFEASFSREPGTAISMLGLLLLAATPALRVIALIVLWTRERDRRFALTALGVALLIFVAALVGHG